MNELGYLALESIKDNQLDKTDDYIQQSLQQAVAEQDEQSAFSLAVQFQQLGFVRQAIDICQVARTVWETDEWLVLYAELLIETGEMAHLDEALDCLLRIEEESDMYASALLIMADIYVMMQLFEVAEHKLTLAKQLFSDEPAVDLARADLYVLMGKSDIALTLYERLLEQAFFDKSMLIKKIAHVLNELGEFEESIFYLEQLSDTQHHSDSLLALGLAYYQLEQYKKAIQILDMLLFKDPDYFSAYRYLGAALLKEKEWDRAEQILQQAVLDNPYDTALYTLLYTVYRQTHQPNKIDALFEKAHEYVSEDTQYQVLYVNHLLMQEAYEEMIEWMTAQQVEEEDPMFYWLLALAYGKLEEDNKAQYYYARAYEIYKTDASFLQDYADYLQEIGQIDKRQAILKQLKQMKQPTQFCAD